MVRHAYSPAHFIAASSARGIILFMTTQEKVKALIRQVVALPDEAQEEVMHSLVEMRAENLGIYRCDDDERAALALSGENVRHGRFAPDADILEIFARHGA